jgi:hypothetical protein
MSSFGDYEPEDAWDVDDTVPAQLENLRRRVLMLYLFVEQPKLDTLAEIVVAVIRATRRGDLSDRDRLRIIDLFVDIEHVRGRV